MTSSQPSTCCYHGVKHEGIAQGEFLMLKDFETYVKYPENGETETGILL
jgi:hypothetical protein